MRSVKLIIFHILILFLASNFSIAQIEPKAKVLTTCSFRQLIGGVILLKAQIGDLPDTLNFILDTGSGGISLDSQTVVNLKLPQIASDRTVRGIAGIHKTNLVNSYLQLPGLLVDSLSFHIGNYQILTSVYGVEIHGIIGYALLKRFILAINFDQQSITFYSNGFFKYSKRGCLLKPVIHFVPEQNATLIENSKEQYPFLFDMGAGLCLMLSQKFAQKNIALKDRKLYPKLAEGIGGEIEMNLTVVKKFKLGKYAFRKVPTYIFEDPYHLMAQHKIGGLIGIDLLRRFNIVLNYSKSEFHITPNSHFDDQFDYAYSGLELCYADSMVLICNVISGSPGEKAGLKKGDILIAVGANTSNDIIQYKSYLQKTTGKIQLIVKRNGTLFNHDLKTIRIY